MANNNLKNTKVNQQEAEVIQNAGGEVANAPQQQAEETPKKGIFQRIKESKTVRIAGTLVLALGTGAAGYFIGRSTSGGKSDGYYDEGEDFAPTYGGDDAPTE